MVERRRGLGRNVYSLTAVSFFTDVSSEMIYPLLPAFVTSVLGASAGFLGGIEGAAESLAALLKLASGWWSDRVQRRKPLVVGGYGLACVVRPLIALATAPVHVLIIRLSDRVGKGMRNAPRDALIADAVDPKERGRAFGFQRAGDNAGAFLGPLIAFAILATKVSLRTVFWYAAIPGVIGVVIAAVGPRDIRRERAGASAASLDAGGAGAAFWGYLVVLFLFTLGNSTDAFLLLRATQLGVPVALAPVLWALLNGIKSLSNIPGGALSDRIPRKVVVIAGWTVYATVYVLFAFAAKPWHVWVLFAVYGVYFGLTEGTERALVADLAPTSRRGAAFGWYNLAIGVGALPASVIFGIIWDRTGAATAFLVGALFAFVAAVGLLFVRVPRSSPA